MESVKSRVCVRSEICDDWLRLRCQPSVIHVHHALSLAMTHKLFTCRVHPRLSAGFVSVALDTECVTHVLILNANLSVYKPQPSPNIFRKADSLAAVVGIMRVEAPSGRDVIPDDNFVRDAMHETLVHHFPVNRACCRVEFL